MNLLVSLDVAFGLVVVYLTFALALTALNEGVAAALGSRAKWLRRGVAALLTPDGGDPRKTATDAFYDSPFVSFLGQGGWARGGKPSYLAAWTLMQGAIDSASAHAVQVFDSVAAVRRGLAHLPAQSPLRVALEDLCARSGDDLGAFRAGLEHWFEAFAQQVGAWYRQKTHFVLLALSCGVAAVMNVDTLALARQLATDPQVRAAAVALGQQAAKDQAAVPELTAAGAREQIDRLAGTGLAIGWTDAEWREVTGSGWLLAKKLGGLLVSALAISLGAPFWFDILKRVAAVRAVGLNLHERSERPKPPPKE
jgi:hypothetical protein